MVQRRRYGIALTAVLVALPLAAAADPGLGFWRDRDGVDPAVTTPAFDRSHADAITDGGRAAVRTETRPGKTAPRVSISTPAVGDHFTVGRRYALQGSATDAEDGPVPANALSWTVVAHHARQTRPFSGPVTGSSTSIIAPLPPDLAAAADSYLEIRLTATDADGVSATVSRRFEPAEVAVTMATAPAGRTVSVNGRSVVDGTTVTSWAGYPLALGVPEQYDATGRELGFGTWSDGGAASHPFVTPAGASTVTATLRPGPTGLSGVSVSATGPTSATISWTPPRDSGGSALIGYSVSRTDTGRADRTAYAATVGATSRSFTMTGLEPGRTYAVTVSPFNAYATGPRSTTQLVVPGPTRAAAPRAGPDG